LRLILVKAFIAYTKTISDAVFNFIPKLFQLVSKPASIAFT